MLLDHPLRAGSKVLIEDAVWTLVQSFRQRAWNTPESGGILLGYRRGQHLHAVIATRPAAKDRRTRNSFVRQDPAHQVQALTGWRRSHGRMDYLGDWHTHAEPFPAPSAIDKAEWTKICSITKQPMVFLIVGTNGYWFGVGEGRVFERAYEVTPDLA